MSVEIRPAVDQDIAAMAAIRSQAWESEAYWLSRIGKYLEAEQSPQHALEPRAAFVAVDAGVVVGFVAGHRTRRYECDGELQWIDTAQGHRRRGIAGALLDTVAAWFVEQNALRVCVNVVPENFAARGLYTKYGARPLNENWLVWEDIRVIGAQRWNDH
jgi:GNAT superfamily N-acetyltransferase